MEPGRIPLPRGGLAPGTLASPYGGPVPGPGLPGPRDLPPSARAVPRPHLARRPRAAGGAPGLRTRGQSGGVWRGRGRTAPTSSLGLGVQGARGGQRFARPRRHDDMDNKQFPFGLANRWGPRCVLFQGPFRPAPRRQREGSPGSPGSALGASWGRGALGTGTTCAPLNCRAWTQARDWFQQQPAPVTGSARVPALCQVSGSPEPCPRARR